MQCLPLALLHVQHVLENRGTTSECIWKLLHVRHATFGPPDSAVLLPCCAVILSTPASAALPASVLSFLQRWPRHSGLGFFVAARGHLCWCWSLSSRSDPSPLPLLLLLLPLSLPWTWSFRAFFLLKFLNFFAVSPNYSPLPFIVYLCSHIFIILILMSASSSPSHKRSQVNTLFGTTKVLTKRLQLMQQIIQKIKQLNGTIKKSKSVF